MTKDEEIANLKKERDDYKNKAGRYKACLSERAPFSLQRLIRFSVPELKIIAIDTAVKRCDGNKARAARFLGIGMATLLRWIGEKEEGGLLRGCSHCIFWDTKPKCDCPDPCSTQQKPYWTPIKMIRDRMPEPSVEVHPESKDDDKN